MVGPAWAVTELLSNAAIVAGVQWYIHRKLGTRGRPLPRLVLGGLACLAVISFLGYLHTPDVIRIPVLAAASAAYAMLVAGGAFSRRLMHAFLVFLLAAASDAAAISLVSFLPGATIGMIYQQTPARLYAMITGRLLFYFLVLLFSLRRDDGTEANPQWIILSAVPLTSVGMMALMIHCESLTDGRNTYGLLGLSAGLLVINVVLLALHDRLYARARQLAEAERLLQQAEMQNRYYQEVLAASDNMQGFRHDIKNHLQVLGGLLEMNMTDKAGHYLEEIGAFLRANEVATHSGHPLLDAVLGAKIAMGKKIGVEIRHLVQLEKEIGIDPMDLCSILGNTLDNALEECERLGAGGRYITLELASVAGAVRLTVGNSAGPAGDESQNGKSKKPGKGHGIGLAIVRRAVAKYGGTMETTHEEKAYQVRINIPL